MMYIDVKISIIYKVLEGSDNKSVIDMYDMGIVPIYISNYNSLCESIKDYIRDNHLEFDRYVLDNYYHILPKGRKRFTVVGNFEYDLDGINKDRIRNIELIVRNDTYDN